MDQLPPLPDGWEERRDGRGNVFFVDHVSQTTSWLDPRLRPTSTPPTAQVIGQSTSTTTAYPTSMAGGTTPAAEPSASGQNPPIATQAGTTESASTSNLETLSAAENGPDSPRRKRWSRSPDRRWSNPLPNSGRGASAGGDGVRGAAISLDLSRDEVTFSPQLIPDDDRSQCFICGERFAPLRRRHHCRCCGEVVCAACSPARQMIPITEAGYDRPRRVCTRCSAHLTAGDHTCPARYAVAIAAPGADAYHKHGAIRHLSAAMESAAKKTRPSSGGGVGEGPGISEASGGKTSVVGPLAALENVHGGPQAFFAELVPMLSTEVPLDVCAHACQLVGASLLLASRMPSPETWVKLVSAIPDAAVDNLLQCLRVAPARAKAARALFYSAKAPLPAGAGGAPIETRSGVQIILEVLKPLPVKTAGPSTSAALAVRALRMWLCATLQPVVVGRPRAAQALIASGGIALLCRQLEAGPADVAIQACGVLKCALRPENGRTESESLGDPDAAREAVESGIAPPLLAMLANSVSNAHASALAMELLAIMSDHPSLLGPLRSAGTIAAVAACLEDSSRAREASSGTQTSIVQSALVALGSFLRGSSHKIEAADTAVEIGAAGADVGAVSLLRAPDAITRYFATELTLQLVRQGRPAPAPAFDPSAGRTRDVAKIMITAGALEALWGLCSDPYPRTRPIALEALATLLGTAAAMSRSTTTSEAVLSLMARDVVGRLAREHVAPTLAAFGRIAKGSAPDMAPATTVTTATATFALRALHFLAANPDPNVFGLFLPAAGVDDPGNGLGTASATTVAPVAGGTPWDTILSSVERAASAAPAAFVEAALLAAGSVCGAPPLPTLRVGGDGGGSESTPVDDVSRILKKYDERTKSPESQAAASSATARGLATQAMLLLAGVPRSMSLPSSVGGGFAMRNDAMSSTAATGRSAEEANTSRAALRVVWALSKGPSSATLAAHDILPRLMELAAARRRKNGNGVEGQALGVDDTSAAVLVLDTISTFLGMDGPRPTSGISPEAVTTMTQMAEELCEMVLEGAAEGRTKAGGSGGGSPAADPLGPRSLSLLAVAVKNPLLRPILLASPRFPIVLDILLIDRSSPRDSREMMTLAALDVVLAAINDENTASRLARQGLVFKLTAIVRQATAGPPPPLPPRTKDGAEGNADADAGNPDEDPARKPSGVSATRSSASSPTSPESTASKTARREEVQAALSVLSGLAQHDSCVPIMLESGDLGCLLQIIRDSASTADSENSVARHGRGDSSGSSVSGVRSGSGFSGAVGGGVRAERRREVEEALRCLLLLTARRDHALHRALGLTAALRYFSSPRKAQAAVQALFDLGVAEGDTALQIIFQLVAGEGSKPVAASPILRPLAEDPRLRVVQRLLGPAAFAFPAIDAENKSLRQQEALVNAARARACDALRHACEPNSDFSSPSPIDLTAASSAATAASDKRAPPEDGVLDGGDSVEITDSVPEADGARTTKAPSHAPGGDANDATAARVGALDVESVVGVVPSVLDLAGTVEGARCLRAMVSCGSGVGESVRTAILRGGNERRLAEGDEETAPRGIRAVVHMLMSKRAEVRAFGASILRIFVSPPPPPFFPSKPGTPTTTAAVATVSLLEGLHASSGGGGCRPEAIRLLARLDLFGNQEEDGGDENEDEDDDRGGDSSGGGGRIKVGASREARWRRCAREDGAAVLMGLVTAVTSAAVSSPTAGTTEVGKVERPRYGGRRHGAGGRGAAYVASAGRDVGFQGFDAQESEALSAVSVEGLRALATDALADSVEKARCLFLLGDLALDPGCARTLFRQGAVPQMLLNAQGCSHAVPEDAGYIHRCSRQSGGSGRGDVGQGRASITSVMVMAAAEDIVDNSGNAASNGRSSPASTTPAESEAGTSGQQPAAAEGAVATEVGDDEGQNKGEAATAISVELCSCRQAMRLLARLVRVLPGEASAVVVKHSGLRSIVQILEEAAAVTESSTVDGGSELRARTDAAAAEALELFVALSEQSPHRRALVNVPGLLHTASSYVVSRTPVAALATSDTTDDSAEPSQGEDCNGEDQAEGTVPLPTDLAMARTSYLVTPPRPEELRHPRARRSSPTSSVARSATELAFRLLGNLASTDDPRRTIMEMADVVLVAAAVVKASAVSSTTDATAGAMRPAPGDGEAAAALLGRLAPVLGAEGSESAVVATCKALSAAVCAAAANRDAAAAKARRNEEAARRTGVSRGRGRGLGGFTGRPSVGLALEALSGLLVLSWSDACSLEAAAGVDEAVTDPLLVSSVVSLWRREMTDVYGTSHAGAGKMSSVALGLLSSVAWRPAGRQALIAGGAVSAMAEVASGGRNVEGKHRAHADVTTNESQRRWRLSTEDRSEILRLLCVLCATPVHRAAVRASLVTFVEDKDKGKGKGKGDSSSRGGSSIGGSGGVVVDQEESEHAVKAAIFGLQGGGGGARNGEGSAMPPQCRPEASRLALLLGVSLPPTVSSSRNYPRRRLDPGTSAVSGAAAVNGSAASPSPAGASDRKMLKPPTPTRSPTRGSTEKGLGVAAALPERRGGGGGSAQDADIETLDYGDLEEALFPTTAPGSSGSDAAGRFSTVEREKRRASTLSPPTTDEAIRHTERGGRTQRAATFPATPVASASAPGRQGADPVGRRVDPPQHQQSGGGPHARRKSGGSLERRQPTLSPDQRRIVSQREAPGSVGDVFAGESSWSRDQLVVPGARQSAPGSSGGGSVATGGRRGVQDDGRVVCRACGGVVFAPKGFDLALVDCPHCRQALG